METYKTISFVSKEKAYALRIYWDEDCESPRQWDNQWTMICFHNRYDLGDKHEYKTPDDFREEYEAAIEQNTVLLGDLYLYDHSGITISLSPFSCQWDSGQVGWVVLTIEKFNKEYGTQYKNFGELSAEEMATILHIREVEVKLYDEYIRGNCFRFELHSVSVCECCAQTIEKDVDSCAGFIGDIEDNGLLEHVLMNFDKEERERINELILKQL